MAIDPVCKMKVDEKKAPATSDYRGKKYYFCAPGCKRAFDQNPEKYIGGRLIVYGGIPFNLCLGISCPDIGDNSPADIVYTTGRHVGPIFAGDTVFASTEVREKRDYAGREDLGVLAVTLKGHKFRKPKDGETGPQKVDVFYLERELAVRRRSHYA